MYILFFHPLIRERNAEISYDSLHSLSGFSGTETALIEMSKYLVDRGHTVHIVGMTSRTFDDNTGIKFIKHPDEINNWYIYDWYSPIFCVYEELNYYILHRLKPNRTRILFWFQCFIDDNFIWSVIRNKFKTYAQCLSHYVECEYMSVFDRTRLWTIGNGISPYFIADPEQPIKPSSKGKWIFHASFERGGAIAVKVYKKVKALLPEAAKEMHLLSYCSADTKSQNKNADEVDNIIVHPSLSKKGVASLLADVEYFVYPLALPSGAVHHDTFGTVMLESLASGVIVLTWDVACIPALYGDNVVRLPVPEHVKREYNPMARFARHPFFQSQEAMDMFVEKILHLEQNPGLKEEQRIKGINWASSQTWDNLGAKMERALRIAMTN